MIVPLKRKYRVRKIVKNNGVAGDHNQKAQKKKGGPKTYTYGSRVMVMKDAVSGHVIMVNGDQVA